MQSTYEQAITQVFKDEGGYTNESTDPGGPTNWGITIHDARQYWKSGASAEDVRQMPESVARDIYYNHYAKPINYDSLPAGVDYAVLDYGINSGINRAVRVLQAIVGVTQDGMVGPNTIAAVASNDSIDLIRRIYDERLAFLKTLHNWNTYGHGWTIRCTNGRALALSMVQRSADGAAQQHDTTVSQQPQGHTMTDLTHVGDTIVKDIADATKALQAIETALPTVIGIAGTFYPPLKAITPFLPLIQEALTAVNTVATQSGQDIATAIQDVINTLTPGKPNAPALQ